jgi:hypothetical protein
MQVGMGRFKISDFQLRVRRGPARFRRRLRGETNCEIVDATAAVPTCVGTGPADKNATGSGLSSGPCRNITIILDAVVAIYRESKHCTYTLFWEEDAVC